ncbi:hypothetical protein NUU61_010197 [Penicillium alfredii]|uniref:LSM complex subunit LSM4 n=1 Tax=Penicillium alfredii TaxID=1506179 RepID=A0A9W9EHK5_9EURO|nr:uncharacterized protein NUU61_010197 [Penicillium alfredii]KAJ5081933.1 hypothetical protein NUU61_010197 [Penicillium alfredii]
MVHGPHLCHDLNWIEADSASNQLPLGLLTAAQGHPMLVELKNGETLNGHLVTCDNWMNLILREVVQTSPEGDRFFKLPEVYIRGNNVCPLARSGVPRWGGGT